MTIKKLFVVFGLIIILIFNVSFADQSLQLRGNQPAPHVAFILFYMASCPHCRRFDPILKAYAISHHIPVLAFTMDGTRLPSFPRSLLPTQAEINRFFPNGNPVVPTLFLMKLDQKTVMPVLKGEATMLELDQRVKAIEVMHNQVNDE